MRCFELFRINKLFFIMAPQYVYMRMSSKFLTYRVDKGVVVQLIATEIKCTLYKFILKPHINLSFSKKTWWPPWASHGRTRQRSEWRQTIVYILYSIPYGLQISLIGLCWTAFWRIYLKRRLYECLLRRLDFNLTLHYCLTLWLSVSSR